MIISQHCPLPYLCTGFWCAQAKRCKVNGTSYCGFTFHRRSPCVVALASPTSRLSNSQTYGSIKKSASKENITTPTSHSVNFIFYKKCWSLSLSSLGYLTIEILNHLKFVFISGNNYFIEFYDIRVRKVKSRTLVMYVCICISVTGLLWPHIKSDFRFIWHILCVWYLTQLRKNKSNGIQVFFFFFLQIRCQKKL